MKDDGRGWTTARVGTGQMDDGAGGQPMDDAQEGW